MSDIPDPPQKRPNRLSPDELARDVVSRLRGTSSQRTERRRRVDVVTISRVAIAIAVVLIGGGAAMGVSWISQLGGYQTTGIVAGDTSLFGCPGETELGVLFSGETVQVVGRSADGAFLTVRDERGPGNLAYAPVGSIADVASPEQLKVRRCEPRAAAEVAAMVQTSTTGVSVTTLTVPQLVSTTSAVGTTTSTEITNTGSPPGGGSNPGPPTPTPTVPDSPSPSQPTTTAGPGNPVSSTTSTTRPRATTTTRPGTTTSTTTTTTAPTTTMATTTTTEVTTTTTEVTTTTAEETTPTG